MIPKTVSYNFGRLNIFSSNADKRKLILDSLRQTVEVEVKQHRYGFFDVGEIEYSDHSFAYGTLAKFRPELTTEVADRDTHTLEDTVLRDSIVAKAPFVIHIRTGLVAFRTASGHITIANFRKYFVELFRMANDYFFIDADIQSVTEDLEIRTAMRTLKAILVVDLTLHPTNPSNRHLYKRTDERIKELGAGTVRERITAKNEDRGLRVQDDEETLGKIAMAEDGYGSAKITGIRNEDGKKVTYSTKDDPITAAVDRDAELPADIVSQLFGTFSRLFDRKNR